MQIIGTKHDYDVQDSLGEVVGRIRLNPQALKGQPWLGQLRVSRRVVGDHQLEISCARLPKNRFRFTPESGHLRVRLECTLSAKSGRRLPSILNSQVVGATEGHVGLITIRGPCSMRCIIGSKDRPQKNSSVACRAPRHQP